MISEVRPPDSARVWSGSKVDWTSFAGSPKMHPCSRVSSGLPSSLPVSQAQARCAVTDNGAEGQRYVQPSGWTTWVPSDTDGGQMFQKRRQMPPLLGKQQRRLGWDLVQH
jgi:hypothetical protein